MKRKISVVGSAVASVEPDVANVSCGVVTRGANAQEVLARANESLHRIIEAAVAAGVDRSDLRTRGPNLHPTEHGYQGSNDLVVVARDLGSLGGVIDAMVAAGGPDVTLHGVNFSVADPSDHLPELRVAAMAAALEIATQLASAGGAAVGEVLTIDESSGYQAPTVMAMESRGTRLRGTPVEAGQQQVRIDVNVTYRLIDPS